MKRTHRLLTALLAVMFCLFYTVSASASVNAPGGLSAQTLELDQDLKPQSDFSAINLAGVNAAPLLFAQESGDGAEKKKAKAKKSKKKKSKKKDMTKKKSKKAKKKKIENDG